MNIYLIKDGQNAGPYSEPEIMSRVQAGSYTLADLAWFDGCTSPVPLAQIFARTPPVTPRPAPAPVKAATSEIYSAEELTQMADLQRKLLFLGLAWIVYIFIPVPESLNYLERAFTLIACGCWFRFGWKLARLLHEKPWVWVVFSLIPLLNFYAWGRILWTATKVLRANGIPCGFMGADQAALNRLGKTV